MQHVGESHTLALHTAIVVFCEIFSTVWFFYPLLLSKRSKCGKKSETEVEYRCMQSMDVAGSPFTSLFPSKSFFPAVFLTSFLPLHISGFYISRRRALVMSAWETMSLVSPVGSVDKTVSARGHGDGIGGKRDGLLHIHVPISMCYVHKVPGELSVESSPNNIPQHTSSMS